MALTKNDIIDALYSELGFPKKEGAKIVESLFEIIKEELTGGNDIMISGVGKWSVKSKRERIGRNPRTGEAMPIKARKVITFKCSNILREEINNDKHKKND